jgi:hypothetical protein
MDLKGFNGKFISDSSFFKSFNRITNHSRYEIFENFIFLHINQRRIFIFSFGVVDKYLGGAAACFGWGVVATPVKAKGKV